MLTGIPWSELALLAAVIIAGGVATGILAGLFGIGWGLSGFCPGPAITSLPLLSKGALVFVPTMLIGIGLARLLVQGRSSGKAVSAGTSKA